ncbi:kinase-like domain-containing protein [Pilaira anomala]|nr:kinase-like domain-containing protein [Pilaira anomala]
MLTTELKATYSACNHGFKYNATNNPRRVLTKPSKASQNDGFDNDDFDYILYVNELLGSTEGHKYLILDVLGSGTFGQVVKCRNTKTQEIVAVKVVKNKLAYFKQSMMEVAILEMLNQRYDEHDKHHLLRLRDTFIHKKHLCLVFELLSVNLYELIKQNHFRGLSTNLVRVFTAQILDALTVLNEARIIHCDLKPENILLKNLESPTIKVIDFGSACHEVQTMYTYIQSRFYRSPEVLVGLPYTSAIDMWSLGCIAAELFLGLPLFPGSSEYNQLSRIVDMLGTPPNYMIEVGKNAHRYFDRDATSREKRYELKPLEKYAREQGKSEQPSKRYFSSKTLPDLINTYPIMRKTQMSSKEIEKGLLNLNPIERWSPQQAKKHPFITGEPFICPFQPPFISRKQHHVVPKSNSTNNGYRSQSAYSDPFLSPSYSSLPNTNGMSKRSSYIPPLPSVLEPPHTNVYSQHLQPQQPQQQQHQPQPHQQQHHSHPHHSQQQSLHIPQSGPSSSRPRANTVGTMQVPPQIQWATVDHNDGTVATEGSLYSPYYPYGQQHQHQQQYINESNNNNSKESMDIGLLPRWTSNNRQTIDLERDGDWQEDTSPSSPLMMNSHTIPVTTTTTNRLPHHKRSNSSVRFSDIPTSISSSVSSSIIHGNSHSSGTRSSVASFHRLMRGHQIPYSRQDIEWDGVIHQTPPPPPPPPVLQPSRSQHDNEENDKWKNENSGWMIA